jgi:serine/threonine protein phosphatase PrpC
MERAAQELRAAPLTGQPEHPGAVEPTKPEPLEEAKENHPLVADAGVASEKDAWKGVPNQDAFFVDAKHGVFGIFDGLGGNIEGDRASSTARDYVQETLASDFPLVDAEQAIKAAMAGASEKIWVVNEPRYLQKNSMRKNGHINR